MKFDDLVDNENSEKIGAISFKGYDMHLCDHIEAIDGQYYATAACGTIRDMDAMKKLGAPTNIYGGDFYVAYLDAEMLADAAPKFDDSNMTIDMIDRLKHALKSMNEGRFAQVA